MLCRSWLVECLVAAREHLPAPVVKRCVSSGCFYVILSFLVFGSFISVQAQSAPNISSICPTVGQVSPVGSPVTITGTGFGAAQGTSTVTFGGVTATTTSWSDTRVVARVPASLATGFTNVAVTVYTPRRTTRPVPVVFVIPPNESLSTTDSGSPLTTVGSLSGAARACTVR